MEHLVYQTQILILKYLESPSTYSNGKEYMFAELANSGDYFATIKKDGYWYMFEKTDDGVCYMFSRTTSKETGILSEKIAVELVVIKIPQQSLFRGFLGFLG